MGKESSGCLLEVLDHKKTIRIVLKTCVLDRSGRTIEAEMDDKDGPCPDLQGGMEGRLFMGEESFQVVIEEILDFPALRLIKVPPRKNVRVDIFLPITINRISPQDLPDLLQNNMPTWPRFGDSSAVRLLNEVEGESTQTYNEINTAFPALYRILADMNAKLDLLLCLVGNDEYRALLASPPRKINISGSGMAFYSDQIYRAGEHIIAKMVLPLSPMVFVELIGEVVACSVMDKPQEEKTIYRVAINFISISDESKEEIIRYVFQRQREILRERDGRSEEP